MGTPPRCTPTMQAIAPDHSTWLRRAVRFVSDLHNGIVPLDKTVHRSRIEALIPDLQYRSFKSTDEKEKILLRTLEMRARGVRDRLISEERKTN